ncbi:DUF116 domain-containing protein [bacterium]|nr:DUF116 domain-containing protein [bacterium]
MLTLLPNLQPIITMPEINKPDDQQKKKKRVLGDEWVNWKGEIGQAEIKEGKNTFLLLSLLMLVGLIILFLVFLYIALPRFELYGRVWATILTVFILMSAVVLFLWYLLLIFNILLKKFYLKACLDKNNKLFLLLLPYVFKLANLLGISRDRISHSFILVNNSLVNFPDKEGPILALLPRCLRSDLLKEIKRTCEKFPDVVFNIAPGGNIARKQIADTSPRAIVAVACERDLLSGIQEIAPKIPVIGIPNTRPDGPCRNTVVDLEEFESALKFFQNQNSS